MSETANGAEEQEVGSEFNDQPLMPRFRQIPELRLSLKSASAVLNCLSTGNLF